MKRIIILFFLVVILAAGIATFLVLDIGRKVDVASIQSFEDCKAAGFPIMESYPAQCMTPDRRSFTEVVPVIQEQVRITSPQSNSIVSSPLTVFGLVRSEWFIEEGSFPIIMRNAAGEEVGRGVAQPDEEIATLMLVPFTALLTFDDSIEGSGVIVFEWNNFSSEIPVQFRTTTAE